jgi:DNA-binding NtrC family response regulator
MERQINILVVDDEQIVLDSVKKHLRKTAYNVHGVSSVQKALLMMEETEFDLVLTDLMMPHIDGLELMKIVKSHYPKVPVIMITGYAAADTARQATRLGAFDNVAKPFSKAELITAINRALDFVEQMKSSEDDASRDDRAGS